MGVLSVSFPKRPGNQCSSPIDFSSISFADMQHFFTIQCHYFSNPAIFLAIFNFMLIKRHDIMAYNLESHIIAKKMFWHATTTCALFSLMTDLINLGPFVLTEEPCPVITFSRSAFKSIV